MDRAGHQELTGVQTRSLPRMTQPFKAASIHAKARSFPSVENEAVESLLKDLLLEPTRELRERPSHQFRGHLVQIGAELSGLSSPHTQDHIKLCSDAIEYLHLGSLIVDDIQDGSSVRRNGPSLHSKLGVPHALSVGNWLYFRALRLLEDLDIDADRRLRLDAHWHEAMELAHYGQVMDLSVSIEQVPLTKIVDICHHCALYKTGSITALAIGMGALIHGASPRRLLAVKKIGAALGVYLQQLNDIGNIIGSFDEEKRYEDLLSRKPSYIWSFTLERFGKESFAKLLRATRALPDSSRLEAWINEHNLQHTAQESAEHMFNEAVQEFMTSYPKTDLSTLIQLKNRILKAYA